MFPFYFTLFKISSKQTAEEEWRQLNRIFASGVVSTSATPFMARLATFYSLLLI